MNTIIEFTLIGTLSLILTLIFIPIIKKIAVQTNLVDKPNYRKVHATPVPLVGGISIAITTFIVLFVSGNKLTIIKEYLPILSSGLTLLIVGAIDDKTDISAKYKLIIQLLLSFFIAFSGIRIISLYGLFGIYEINTWMQYALTILVITGVVNAFNLIDGVDGLVGGLSLLGFTMFLIASTFYNNYFLGKISVIFIGAIIGFLKFNLSKKKIFMGDAGSLFIGFILVTLGIKFMEDQRVNNDYGYTYGFLILVAFFSIPVLDSMRVYIGRMKEGNSPFKADKSHFHHLLLMVGLTHKKTTVFVVIFCMILFLMGLGLISYISTTLIIVAYVTLFGIITKLLLMICSLHKWRDTIKLLEQK
jgi:UDP-GlcNAc:undecaprenyl-phosphate GlcNAc-1-phosphate transferase